ncbi:hypothetical protein [Mycolicibacterium sediminis]|uniref:Peptide chain release factor 2 n=1 Tax=Mycolicibacterium sediminis TaxID=1286180 RepID=A0A7I7QKZ3_9MYCO|nr:hypothetical protein [Mycolicibacterium sediminis]BBY26935.1 hypothetical protein MSEDJ_10310 [Mycolicibacterium sediminis]
MEADRFTSLLESKGPYASVYWDDSHDTEDAAAQRELKWRAIREDLERQGASPGLVDALQRAIVESKPPVGRSGRGVVAGEDGVLLNEHLIRPLETPETRVSTLPYLVPLVTHAPPHATYFVATVDHAGGDVTLHHDGRVRSETVDGGGYPIHKADSAETPGYGDPQRRTMEAGRKNLRAVADRLTHLVDSESPDVVFVVGEVQSRADLTPILEQRVADLVVELDVGARNSGVDDAAVRRAIDEELLRRRVTELDAAAQSFSLAVGQGSGLATQGLHGVCAALRAGAVETLIIGDVGDSTVVAGDDLSTVAPNPNVLSELGTAPTQTLRADEALPFVAVSIGAALIRTDERIAPDDGLGAILRYPLP